MREKAARSGCPATKRRSDSAKPMSIIALFRVPDCSLRRVYSPEFHHQDTARCGSEVGEPPRRFDLRS